MTNPAPETHDTVALRAAAFFEQRRFGAWSDADQAALVSWIGESFLHRAAWLRLEGAVAHTEYLVAYHPHEFPKDVQARAGKPFGLKLMLPLLAAASIAVFAAFGIPYVNSLMSTPDRTYSTDVGGLTLLKFADGTQIELDTDTVLRFRMTGEERKVWLEKGDAWFRVAHDAANPFIVFVGNHRVTDLGTEFLVRRGDNGMEVALLTGRASLSAEGAPLTMLKPGDDAIATPVSVSVIRRTPQELADALAWQRGALVFRSTRLADAVREVNRYNRTQIVIADPSISDMKFTGEIKSDNFEGFLHIAETMMGLRAERQGKDIFLSRGPAKQTKSGAP